MVGDGDRQGSIRIRNVGGIGDDNVDRSQHISFPSPVRIYIHGSAHTGYGVKHSPTYSPTTRRSEPIILQALDKGPILPIPVC